MWPGEVGRREPPSSQLPWPLATCLAYWFCCCHSINSAVSNLLTGPTINWSPLPLRIEIRIYQATTQIFDGEQWALHKYRIGITQIPQNCQINQQTKNIYIKFKSKGLLFNLSSAWVAPAIPQKVKANSKIRWNIYLRCQMLSATFHLELLYHQSCQRANYRTIFKTWTTNTEPQQWLTKELSFSVG